MSNQLQALLNNAKLQKPINGTILSNFTGKQTTLVKFSLDELTAIAGGHSESPDQCEGLYLNHNETLVHTKKAVQPQQLRVKPLSMQDLAAIAGGNSDGKPEDEYDDDALSANHNETVMISDLMSETA